MTVLVASMGLLGITLYIAHRLGLAKPPVRLSVVKPSSSRQIKSTLRQAA